MSPRTRYLAAGLLALVSLGGPSALVPFASHGSDDVEPEVAVTLQDGSIDESSGLVVRGSNLFTVNDSGDGPHVYEVDLRTGETTGVTTYAADDPEDVEALARGRGGTVWVGDIGDNRRARGSIRLYRLRPVPGGGTVDAESFDLVYPDRPHDAETLLVHPRTGRVLVVTKLLLGGGVVYSAPRRLVPGNTHELERVARVPGLLTDGAFLPSGRAVLLRTYGSVARYSYPDFTRVADVPLPEQEQGEALAVGDDGRAYLTSEGEGSEVLVVDVPPAEPGLKSSTGPSAGEETPPPADDPRPAPEPESEYDPQPWLGLGLGRFLLVVTGAGLAALLLRAALRRARRRR